MNRQPLKLKFVKEARRARQRGNAGLLAVIFIAFAALTLLTVMTSNSWRETRKRDQSRSKLHEKWQARSGVSVLSQILLKDAAAQLDRDVREMRTACNLNFNLPIFDPDTVLPQSSNPAVIFSGTAMSCTGANSASFDESSDVPAGFATSIFGQLTSWATGRIPLFHNTAETRFGLDAENFRVVQLDEIYRRTLADSDTAYAVRFIVEGKFGNYRTRTSGETILGASLPTCGTSVELQAVPATVERGGQVELRITYSSASRLLIYNSSNFLLHTENVTEQTAPQTFLYTLTPAATDTYYVRATGAGGCQARSANAVVTVTEPRPDCPLNVEFNASATTINSGESVTLSWRVPNAAAVVFEGAPVALQGSQVFTLTASRTFTLNARDAGNTCPVTREIPVTVRPPSCSLSAPTVNTFRAAPSSITIGATSVLSWNITGFEPTGGGSIRLTGPNGFVQTINNPAGNLTVSPPVAAGDYTYTILAENVCPDGTRLPATQSVIISVQACPPPDITAFTVNPAQVVAGGNQMIRFTWTINGTADAVSISPNIGGGLQPSGTLDAPQPQINTNYTLTAVGCGVTRTQQAPVTVVANPPPPSFNREPTIGFYEQDPGGPATICIGGHGFVVSVVNFNNSTGEFVLETANYETFSYDGDCTLPIYVYNNEIADVFSQVVDNTDPCFNALGRPVCDLTRNVTNFVYIGQRFSPTGSRIQRFRGSVPPNTGIPYLRVDFQNRQPNQIIVVDN